jgi:hypothetical protein
MGAKVAQSTQSFFEALCFAEIAEFNDPAANKKNLRNLRDLRAKKPR